jgi:hypothetical protein
VKPLLKYYTIETKDDLARCLDDVIDGVTRMLRKTGEGGQSPEVMVRTILSTVGTPYAFLLVAYDIEDRFVGFCYAVLVPSTRPWVDFMGVWTVPGLASQIKQEAFDMLKAWARSHNAKRIYAGITRKHEAFFKFFHEPLGFRKIGIIVEYDLEKERPHATAE